MPKFEIVDGKRKEVHRTMPANPPKPEKAKAEPRGKKS